MIRVKEQTDKWELVNCNLCGSNDLGDVCSYGKIKIVRCKKCGLIYRNPRSKEDMNREFYSFDYYGEHKGIEERISSARIGLFQNILSRLQKEVRGDSRRILDVGCGQGQFLKLAKDSGWEVEGVELAKSACGYARKKFGIEVRNEDLKEAVFPDAYFDIVTLWNVLDHLLDPLDALKEIYRILKPGGILVSRVPNVGFHLFVHGIFSSLPAGIKSGNLRDPSIIINYGFSKSTISGLLEEAGFRKIRVYNSPLSYGDPYKSFKIFKDYTTNILKKAYFILSQAVYYLSFGKCRMGTSLLAWAEK